MRGDARMLVLWRHGRTEWNDVGRFQGQMDVALDDVGRDQAVAAAPMLATLSPTAIVSSDLSRAADTARALESVTGLTATLDPRLREISLGDWEGMTRAEARSRFPEDYARWQSGEDARRGSGETYAEAGARAVASVMAAYDGLAAGAVLVAVTHGGVARATIGTLLDMAPDAWWRLAPLGNARWSVLGDIGRGWRLEEHNAGSPPEQEPTGDDAR